MVKTKEYSAWANMKTRCNNPNYYLFDRYGGRGVTYCDRWESFSEFLSDMGDAPSKYHSLDRIDNDGIYEPSNCRWATNITQGNNKSTNRIIEYDGRAMSLSDWCRELGTNYESTQMRLDRGMSIEKAFTLPAGFKRYKYITPDGEFDCQQSVADFYNVKLKTVSARFCSKTFKLWYKVDAIG